MPVQDKFEGPIAYNPAGGTDGAGALVPSAEFQVFDVADSSFSTPLAVFDPATGVTINPLRSSAVGVLPDFQVAGARREVLVRSGSFVTRLTSKYGVVFEAGLDPETVQASIAAGAQAEAARVAAVAARAAAEQAAADVAAVVPTNDGIMNAVLANSEAQFTKGLVSMTEGAIAGPVRVAVPIPLGFGWHADYAAVAPHLTIFPDGTRTGDIGMTPAALFGLASPALSAPTHSCYVTDAGSDANNGQTEGAAFRALRAAKNFATGASNKVLSRVRAGDYAGDNGFTGAGQGGSAQSPTRDSAYLAYGGPVNVGPYLNTTEMSGWAGDSRYPYTDWIAAPAYQANRVIDRMLGVDMLKVNSPTLCSREPGSWCFDAQRTFTDAATTSGSATLTSATAAFTRSDLGKVIAGTGIPGGTTIQDVTSATTVTLSAAATATGSGVSVTVGTGRLFVHRADYATPTYRNTRVYVDRNNFLLTTQNNVFFGSLDGSPWVFEGSRTTDTGGGDAAPFKVLMATSPTATRKSIVVDHASFDWAGGVGGIANALSMQRWNGLLALFDVACTMPAKDAFNVHNQPDAGITAAAGQYILTVNCRSDVSGFGDNVSCNGLTGHEEDYFWIDIAGVYKRGQGGTVRSDAASTAKAGRYLLIGTVIEGDRGDTQTVSGVTPPTALRAAGATKWVLDNVMITQPGGTAIYVEAAAKVYLRRNSKIEGAIGGPGTIVYYDDPTELPAVL